MGRRVGEPPDLLRRGKRRAEYPERRFEQSKFNTNTDTASDCHTSTPTQ
jgi:hypothetical protein